MEFPLDIKCQIVCFVREAGNYGTSVISRNIGRQQSLLSQKSLSNKVNNPWIIAQIPELEYTSSGSSPLTLNFELHEKPTREVITLYFYLNNTLNSRASLIDQPHTNSRASIIDQPNTNTNLIAAIAQPLNTLDLMSGFCGFRLAINDLYNYENASFDEISKIFESCKNTKIGRVKLSLTYTISMSEGSKLPGITIAPNFINSSTPFQKQINTPLKVNTLINHTQLNSKSPAYNSLKYLKDEYVMGPNDSASNIDAPLSHCDPSGPKEHAHYGKYMDSFRIIKSKGHLTSIQNLISKSVLNDQFLTTSTCFNAWKSLISFNELEKKLFIIFQPLLSSSSTHEQVLSESKAILLLKNFYDEHLIYQKDNQHLETKNENLKHVNRNLSAQLKKLERELHIMKSKDDFETTETTYFKIGPYKSVSDKTELNGESDSLQEKSVSAEKQLKEAGNENVSANDLEIITEYFGKGTVDITNTNEVDYLNTEKPIGIEVRNKDFHFSE